MFWFSKAKLRNICARLSFNFLQTSFDFSIFDGYEDIVYSLILRSKFQYMFYLLFCAGLYVFENYPYKQYGINNAHKLLLFLNRSVSGKNNANKKSIPIEMRRFSRSNCRFTSWELYQTDLDILSGEICCWVFPHFCCVLVFISFWPKTTWDIIQDSWNKAGFPFL